MTYFLINRMPSFVLNNNISYTILFPYKSLFPIESRVFGSTCFARDISLQITKLNPKSLKCIFLGYSQHQKGYRCFFPTLNRYLMFTNVTFFYSTPLFPSSSMFEGQRRTIIS